MKNAWIIYFLLFFYSWNSLACTSSKEQKQEQANFGVIALRESATPVRAGIPGKRPFWNEYAKRFIYAPAFDFKEIENATTYQFNLSSLDDSATYRFESDKPYSALSPVWIDLPVGNYNLVVTGLSKDRQKVGIAGKREFYRAATFNGIYHEPVMPYDQSAVLALDQLMEKDYVQYWLFHKEPDPDYINYRYPAKIYSALIIGAVTHARLKNGTADAKRSIDLAKIVADYMLSIRFKEGSPWEYFVPTYYGVHSEKAPKKHLKPTNHFSIMGADAGNSFLDLYDYTGEKKYLEAAKKIAETYLKRQLSNGSWYQFVNHETGKPTAENIVIPTAIINYFDRLKRDYKVEGLDESTHKAIKWVMENPVKTFDWQGQFEDISARPPYRNLSREQACDLAIYLFKNKNNPKLAEELVRFSEDQFVIWERPMKIAYQEPRSGGKSENWITPSVQEQYAFWMPVGRSAGIMLDTYWEAYVATKNEMYLAKVKSIANSFTVVQKAHDGDYPTFFTPYPMNKWLNSTVYPSKTLMRLEINLNNIGVE